MKWESWLLFIWVGDGEAVFLCKGQHCLVAREGLFGMLNCQNRERIIRNTLSFFQILSKKDIFLVTEQVQFVVGFCNFFSHHVRIFFAVFEKGGQGLSLEICLVVMEVLYVVVVLQYEETIFIGWVRLTSPTREDLQAGHGFLGLHVFS